MCDLQSRRSSCDGSIHKMQWNHTSKAWIHSDSCYDITFQTFLNLLPIHGHGGNCHLVWLPFLKVAKARHGFWFSTIVQSFVVHSPSMHWKIITTSLLPNANFNPDQLLFIATGPCLEDVKGCIGSRTSCLNYSLSLDLINWSTS